MHFPEKLLKFPPSWKNPSIPAFGTFPWPFKQKVDNNGSSIISDMESITCALAHGYRHIDTAFTYGNQQLIGKAVLNANLPREDLYVTSKLHIYNNFYKDAKQKIKEAINLIWGNSHHSNMNYLDCFMIHYPGVGRPLSAWQAIIEAQKNGLIKHAGVSNFEIKHLEIIKNATGRFPEVNQIEYHPWIYKEQSELVKFCHEHGIAVEGYSPLAQGKDLNNGVIKKLADLHKTTPARIVLKWCMQHGVKPVIGSRNQDNIKMNAATYNFELSDNDVEILNNLSLSSPIRVSLQWNWNPSKAGFGGPVPGQNLLKKILLKAESIKNSTI